MVTSKDRCGPTIGNKAPALPVRGTPAGFTLVEILVAVSILSLLLLGIYGIFSTVSETDRRLQADSAGYHQARILFDRIGREIRGAYRDTAARQGRFQGGIDDQGYPFWTLATTAVTPQSGSPDGVAVVRYQLEPDPEAKNERKVLIRREYPLRDSEGESRPGHRFTTDVVDMQLRFFDGGQWLQEWRNDRGDWPALVELTLVLSSDETSVPFRSAFEVPAIKVR